MAQLLKLSDYASRYELDMYHYSSQFSRFKQERWKKMKAAWLEANTSSINETLEEPEAVEEEWPESKTGFFRRTILKKRRRAAEQPALLVNTPPAQDKLAFYRGKTKEQLIEAFYEELFQSQLRWASSSLLEESTIAPVLRYNQHLKYFLREWPDNFFVLFRPVFYVKNAPVELDIIVITPTEIICMFLLEGKMNSVFDTSTGRFWNEYAEGKITKTLNPAIPMQRMSSMAATIMEADGIELPIRKEIIAPGSIIDRKGYAGSSELIDKQTLPAWLEAKKRNPAPVKLAQIQAAEALFKHTSTQSRMKIRPPSNQ
ncbi:hypothetical protein [Sinobaca sp. H24]|uniref:hypothetical protein n=1 Tax=Sinobaca sp. H24 TaxID=2923376 RepID=UPI00207A3A8B|nr:hypothetical protein [Sinobaca sp. H24]